MVTRRARRRLSSGPVRFRAPTGLTSGVRCCNREGMTTVIVIGALWVGNVLFLRWLGGVGSASDALARWGRATAEKRRHRLASNL